MIKVESGYYYIEEDQKPVEQPKAQQSERSRQNKSNLPLQVIGDVKGYIQHVAAEVKRIKQLKAKQKQESLANKLILDKLSGSTTHEPNLSQIKLEIAVPQEIYELDQRISKLEEKIVNDEIVRQKIQRKGKLSERAKLLSTQIQKLLQKSPETIGNNIQNYCKTLDQKQQQAKELFLYDAFTKTHTLTEEIQMLNIYLSNLNEIQIKLKALPPQKVIVDNHEKLLVKRKANSQRISKLHKYMAEEYEKLVKQIESL